MDDLKSMVNNLCNEYEKEIITIRRDFHKYPESGWTEFRTSSIIADYLNKLGIDIKLGREILNSDYMMGVPDEDILNKNMKRAEEQGAVKKYLNLMTGGYTGVVGIIDTKLPGPTVAFRFDIDANDVPEDKSSSHKPSAECFSSVNENVMHACGHDGHAAIGMIFAKVIKKIEKYLCGKIILIFQPAEEGVRGARSIVEKGLLDNVDYFLCGHIGMSAQTLGQIVCNSNGFLATTKFDATFKGVSSHAGALPEKGKNALLGAATAALNLHTLCQHSEGIGRINVGILKAGTGRNVVPPYAEMMVETRGQTTEINNFILERAKEIIKGSSLMYGLEYNIKIMGGAETAQSSIKLSNLVESQAKLLPDINNITSNASLNGSEDASFMINRVQKNGGQASYLQFGTELSAGHHNSKFDFNEKVLKTAVKIYAFSLIEICRMNK